jgi:hypothetical protein
MSLSIEKSHYRKIKPSWRVLSIAFGGFGINLLYKGIISINDEKLLFSLSYIIVGLLSVENLISGIYGKEFRKSIELVEIKNNEVRFKDTRDRLHEINIESLKHIIAPKKGTKIQLVTNELKVIDFDFYQFAKSEQKSIIEGFENLKESLLIKNKTH